MLLHVPPRRRRLGQQENGERPRRDRSAGQESGEEAQGVLDGPGELDRTPGQPRPLQQSRQLADATALQRHRGEDRGAQLFFEGVGRNLDAPGLGHVHHVESEDGGDLEFGQLEGDQQGAAQVLGVEHLHDRVELPGEQELAAEHAVLAAREDGVDPGSVDDPGTVRRPGEQALVQSAHRNLDFGAREREGTATGAAADLLAEDRLAHRHVAEDRRGAARFGPVGTCGVGRLYTHG